jgi:hypothetical protein
MKATNISAAGKAGIAHLFATDIRGPACRSRAVMPVRPAQFPLNEQRSILSNMENLRKP